MRREAVFGHTLAVPWPYFFRGGVATKRSRFCETKTPTAILDILKRSFGGGYKFFRTQIIFEEIIYPWGQQGERVWPMAGVAA